MGLSSQSARASDDLWSQIQIWSAELGFAHVGVASIDLKSAEEGLLAWLAQGFHGSMHYMQRHGLKRARPHELVPGTVCVLTLSMNYLPSNTAATWVQDAWQDLRNPTQGVVSLYARGRDYHKVLRQRMQRLADAIAQRVAPLGYRVFTDSAPVLEVELATRSGQGWRGKHTLMLNRTQGSMAFLGEIFLDFALPLTPPSRNHCGACTACISVCPTRAIVAPYRLDARRCISYLTIEHDGAIDSALRPLLGNRVYGCDDCQLACPWNKFATPSQVPDFQEREGLKPQTLLTWLNWSQADFEHHTQGSPILRIGYWRWQRNVIIATGNAISELSSQNDCFAIVSKDNVSENGLKPTIKQIKEVNKYDHLNQQQRQDLLQAWCAALIAKRPQADAVLQEHIQWALAQARS